MESTNESKSKEKKKDKKSKKDKKPKSDKKEKEPKDPAEAKYINMDDITKIYQEVDKIIAKLLSDKS